MPALALTADQYLARSSDVEAQGPFRWRLLAEGDSWMDKSGPLTGSLPEYLAREFARRGEDVLIINIARAGDTLRRITGTLQGEFAWWLRQQRFDGILLSAGGNDLIDAARDPDPGQGLLRDLRGQPGPADAADAVRPGALAALQDYLDLNFSVLADAVRADARNAATPVFVHGYDVPTARDAPALSGGSAWLQAAYRRNGIAEPLWPALTAHLFGALGDTVEGWVELHEGVLSVPTMGLLTPAAPGTTGSSGDWLNEIHPNGKGWRKLARVWADALEARLA
jgi:lysophospholipase L1-like esterase